MWARGRHKARAVCLAGMVGLGLVSCVRVEVLRDREAGSLECRAAGRRRVECVDPEPARFKGSLRFALHGGARDLSSIGPVVAGRNICVVSSGGGAHCRNVTTGDKLRTVSAQRIRDRSYVGWRGGICVEAARDSGFSRFECVQAGLLRNRVSFWVAEEHEVVEFGCGACVCGASPRGDMEASPTRVSAWGVVGAACVWGKDEPEPTSPPRATERLRAVSMEGVFGPFDARDVCDVAAGRDEDEVVRLLEHWVGDDESTREELDGESEAGSL